MPEANDMRPDRQESKRMEEPADIGTRMEEPADGGTRMDEPADRDSSGGDTSDCLPSLLHISNLLSQAIAVDSHPRCSADCDSSE